MKRSLAHRLIQALVVLTGVVLITFVMLRIVPGNPIETMMGEHADVATIRRLTAEMGLDQPLIKQFFRYISSAVRGDFGTSYSLGKPVSELIGNAFVNTLTLALLAALFAWIVGLGCGIFSAVNKNRLSDRLFMGASLLGISLPVFMAAMLLQYAFAYRLHWLPVSGTESWKSFILPAVALGWNSAGQVAQMTRSSLLEALEEDYIETARAKGLGRFGVLMRHALRNAMLPVLTMMTVQFSSLLSGAVITETVFSQLNSRISRSPEFNITLHYHHKPALDQVMRTSAKGVLLFPETALPDGWTWEDARRCWSSANGLLPYNPRFSDSKPEQMVTNNSGIGAYQMIELQMKLFEEISGVNGALQGKNPTVNSGGAYQLQSENANIALSDVFDTFQAFRRQRDRKIATIQ